MNLPDFLEKVDALTKTYEKDELAWFIHNIAREYPENERDSFLSKLKKVQNSEEEERGVHNKLLNRFKNTCDKLSDFDEENIIRTDYQIYSSYQYNYYTDEDVLMDYKDPNHLIELFTDAYKLLRELFDNEMYEQVVCLGNKILYATIIEIDDYSGSDYIDFIKFANTYTENIDVKELVQEMIFSTILVESSEEWPERLLEIINTSEETVTLKEIIQMGLDQRLNLESFLETIIEYMSYRFNETSNALLKEAFALKKDSFEYLKNNLDILKDHPDLAVEVLEKEDIPVDIRIKFGDKALEVIPENYTVRSEISLKLAELILMSREDKEALDNRYLESLRSETTLQNFLRAFLNIKDPSQIQESLSELIQKYGNNNYSYKDKGPLRKNVISPELCLILQFLGSDSQETLDQMFLEQSDLIEFGLGLEDNIIRLCLFFLYNKQQESYPNGIEYILNQLKSEFKFSEDGYRKGLPEGETVDFIEIMQELRSKLPDISSNIVSEFIKQFHKALVKKVETIMANNQRDRYYTCAAVIAAFGEVIGSLDLGYTKKQYIDYYISLYPRRRNFIADLKQFSS